jgi:hypothetical protein
MSKWFSKPLVETITIVDPPVSQWYVRRAGTAALVIGLALDAVVTAVASVFGSLWLAVLLGALAGVLSAAATYVLVRVWPVLRVLWWWFFEISAAMVVFGGWAALAHLTVWWIASAIWAATGLAILGPPRSRRFVWAWSGCLIVRHRLRLCFTTLVRSQARSNGRPAALPLLLWARPTPAGERVWLWLRPGLELEDLDGKAGLIAVACIAKQVRVAPASEKYAALLRIDVARRDPLVGRVESPLALLIPSLRNTLPEAPVSPAIPAVGLELADIPEPAAPEPRGGRR